MASSRFDGAAVNDFAPRPNAKASIMLRAGVDTAVLVSELQAHAKARTDPRKYPRAIEFTTEMPLTPTGTIRRKYLRAKG